MQIRSKKTFHKKNPFYVLTRSTKRNLHIAFTSNNLLYQRNNKKKHGKAKFVRKVIYFVAHEKKDFKRSKKKGQMFTLHMIFILYI